MKKIVIMIAVLFTTMAANAQKVLEGAFPSLKGQTKINLVIDYSEIKIAGKSESDWLGYRQTEQPDYNAKDELEKDLKPTVQENLVEQTNEKLKKFNAFLVTDNSGEYTLKVTPKDVAKKGNNIDVCSILDKDGKVLVKFQIKGSGGTFGTMNNLWGDGFKDSGKQLGNAMVKCFKK